MNISPASTATSPNFRRTALLMIGVMLVIKLAAIFTAPVHQDDNYYLNIGSNFFQRGQLSHHMWRLGDTGIIAGGGTGYGLLLMVGWFRVFGLTVLSGRFFSFLAGQLTLLVLFYVTRKWHGARAAWFAVVFAAACGPFFVNFAVRMDAMATLAYSLVLLLHVSAARRRQALMHFVVGVAVIAAAEFHILALCYATGLAVAYAYSAVQTLRHRAGVPFDALAFFLGALLAGVLYLSIHVLPNIDQYLLLPGNCPLCVPAGPHREAMRLVEFFVRYPVETVLFTVAFMVALRRGEPARHTLLITIGAMAGLTVFSPSPQVEYSGHLWPLMAIGVGTMLASGARRGDFYARNSMLILTGVISTLLILHIVRQPFVPVTPIRDDILAYLHARVPRDTVIMGSVRTYYQLLDYPEFMSYRDDERYGLRLRGEDYLTFWGREQPKVFIGTPDDDLELQSYLLQGRMDEVLPDLWVARDLLDE